MLLTISTTHRPATDLGFLLGKNPQRVQSFELSFGQGHVYYPEAMEHRCTAALLLDVDPVALVRRPRGDEGFALSQYTNDRPYVASSFLSVAIGRIFNQALGGRSRERPELAETAIPLEARLAVLPIRGGERFLRALFEPLGYELDLERHPLDQDFPAWGDSVYGTVCLRGTQRLQDLLRHLTVLVPVLDDSKHYWVGPEEIEKLLARGEGWLATHPEREQIAQRYLKHRRSLTRAALERLADEDEREPDAEDDEREREEEQLEKKLTLNEQRMQAVLSALRRNGVRRVVDVGCGEGRLLRDLVRDRTFERIVGMDVSMKSLERAKGSSARGRVQRASEGSRGALSGLPDLPRQAAGGIRWRLCGRSHRAYRRHEARCVRTCVVRGGSARMCRGNDTQCGVQRSLRVAACRKDAASRPPFRVDSGRVSDVGARHR